MSRFEVVLEMARPLRGPAFDALCEEFCAMRRPSRSVAEYHDRAISGATKHRPRLDRLLRDGEQGGFDAILLESLDRLSRDLEHVADFFKQLHFWGVRMLTLNEGEVGPLHIGLRGTIGALCLADLRGKTRRGNHGWVLDGKVAAGHRFNYKAEDRIVPMASELSCQPPCVGDIQQACYRLRASFR
jgi:DNA invertase Pin-like site-specific DNA recombinase